MTTMQETTGAALTRTVAVLFCRADSIYKTLTSVEVFDQAREASSFTGGMPVVAHPPCRGWGRLRHFARPPDGERELAFMAIDAVRSNGGVLEHPACSSLWAVAGLPFPGMKDAYGGFTLAMPQNWFGHPCAKASWFYCCGLLPSGIPEIPFSIEEPRFVVTTGSYKRDNPRWKPEVSRYWRDATPPALAAWLVELARASHCTTIETEVSSVATATDVASAAPACHYRHNSGNLRFSTPSDARS